MATAVKRFKFGWYGDGGLGERIIQSIISGRKRATACLAYEAEDADVKVGDKLELVDKRGKSYATLVVTRIDIRLYGTFDEALANDCGHSLIELRELMRFANGRAPGADEEMRVTRFSLVRLSKIKL